MNDTTSIDDLPGIASGGGGGTGQFIYDEGTHEVMHYVDSQGSE